MRKLLFVVIVTLSLGTFALAQSADENTGQNQGATDWYQQNLNTAAQDYARSWRATPAAGALAENNPQPNSMSSNLAGAMAANQAAFQQAQASGDWYQQTLSRAVADYDRSALIEKQPVPSTE